MKKVLFIATSDIHTHSFHLPYLEWLKKNGCEVHLAIEKRGNLQLPFVDQFNYLSFPRSLFNFSNFASYKELKRIIDTNNYDLIYCHTPIPSAITRLAARKARKRGTKVLYMAHGFHFYKGGPLKNWLTYYPAEWFLSALTDGIVTINAEDFGHINGKMWHKDSFYIKGVGIDTTKFRTIPVEEQIRIRKDLGYNDDDFILLYVAEFIYRKNHQFIIDTLPELIKIIPNVRVVFAGKGILLETIKASATLLGVAKHIDFLGFVSDIGKYAAIADIGISSSRQEGLGLGLAEEMLCSVPIVATVDRGHKEMIIHGESGFMFRQGNQSEFIEYIAKLYHDPDLKKEMGEASYKRAQLFRIENSLDSMASIFKFYLNI